eukprot:4611204-Prymnesium_polylepis.1
MPWYLERYGSPRDQRAYAEEFESFCRSENCLLFLLGFGEGTSETAMKTLRTLHEHTASQQSTSVFSVKEAGDCVSIV